MGTLDRALRAAGWQLAVLPTRAPTAAAVALAVLEVIDGGGPSSEERAFRSLLSLSDGLAAAEPALRVALSAAPPALTGDIRLDAAIAAVVEYHLSRSKLPVPGWVRDPSRTLTEPWTPDPYAGPELATEVPESFRRHGVLLAERELESASLVTLDRDDILGALDELVEVLVAAEARADIRIVGGAAIAVRYTRDAITTDVDALYGSAPEVEAAVQQVARDAAPIGMLLTVMLPRSRTRRGRRRSPPLRLGSGRVRR